MALGIYTLKETSNSGGSLCVVYVCMTAGRLTKVLMPLLGAELESIACLSHQRVGPASVDSVLS